MTGKELLNKAESIVKEKGFSDEAYEIIYNVLPILQLLQFKKTVQKQN